jgi:hypothetical protein
MTPNSSDQSNVISFIVIMTTYDCTSLEIVPNYSTYIVQLLKKGNNIKLKRIMLSISYWSCYC